MCGATHSWYRTRFLSCLLRKQWHLILCPVPDSPKTEVTEENPGHSSADRKKGRRGKAASNCVLPLVEQVPPLIWEECRQGERDKDYNSLSLASRPLKEGCSSGTNYARRGVQRHDTTSFISAARVVNKVWFRLIAAADTELNTSRRKFLSPKRADC